MGVVGVDVQAGSLRSAAVISVRVTAAGRHLGARAAWPQGEERKEHGRGAVRAAVLAGRGRGHQALRVGYGAGKDLPNLRRLNGQGFPRPSGPPLYGGAPPPHYICARPPFFRPQGDLRWL